MTESISVHDRILARMQVPGTPGMFVLGCFERPATFYMQQVRALNLIYALDLADSLENRSMLVVGAGAAGLTAAAAAAMHGCRVTVLERNANDVLSLAGAISSTRWLHPHIYDWPAVGKDASTAGLPLLDWEAGPAQRVIDHLRSSWASLEKAFDIETHVGVTNVRTDALATQHYVQWNGKGPRIRAGGADLRNPRRGMTLQAKRVDLVLLAVGFGKEEPTDAVPNEAVTSYWLSDDIDDGLDAEAHTPIALVSGTGDGGLIDALRYSFKSFRHEDVVARLKHEWLGIDQFAGVRERLEAIEGEVRAARSEGRPHEALLNWSYRELVSGLKFRHPIALREDVDVVLTGTSAYPLTLEAAPINRFLLSLTPAQYIPGPVTCVKGSRDKGWEVWFGKSSLSRRFNKLVLRHGPASAMRRDFPDIFDRCSSLIANARIGVDPSREPCYDENFVQLLRELNAQAQPKQSGAGTVESLATLILVQDDKDRNARLAAYRNALVHSLEALCVNDVLGAMYLVPELLRAGAGKTSSFQVAVDNLDAAWLYTGPGLRCIVGEAGAGKSSILRHLALAVAREATRVVILLEARAIRADTGKPFFVAAIDGAVESSDLRAGLGADALRQLLLEQLLRGRLVLCLDAFDEISTARARDVCARIEADRANLGRGNRLLIASRRGVPLPSSSDSETFVVQSPAFELSPALLEEHGLVDGGAQMMVANLFAAAGLGSSISKLALRFAAGQGESLEAEATGTARGWIERGIDSIQGHWDDGARRALEVLALATIGSPVMSRSKAMEIVEQSLAVNGSAISADQVLSSPLLALTGGEGEELRFVQRPLQEVLAARGLIARCNAQELVEAAIEGAHAADQVGPIAVAWSDYAEACFDILESMPESLDATVLRLRVRATCYRETPAKGDDRLAEDLRNVVVDHVRWPYEVVSELGDACSMLPPATGASVLRALAPQLNALDTRLRVRAIEFMGRARIAGTLFLVAPMLVAADEVLRDAAAKALGSLHDPAAVPMLLDAYLTNTGQSVFSAAIEAIAAIGGGSALEALARVLSDLSLFRNLRWPAASCLGRLGNPAAVDVLVGASTDASEIVREHTLGALGQLRDQRTIPTIVSGLADPEASVRIAAADALVAMARASEVPALLKALQDEHLVVRGSAARALLRLAPDELLVHLRRAIAEPHNVWRAQAVVLLEEALGAAALPTLLSLSQNTDVELRRGSAQALARQTGDAVVESLVALSADTSEEVRRTAVEALGTRSGDAVVSALTKRLRADGHNIVGWCAVSALKNIGGEVAVAALREGVQRGNPFASHFADALGYLGSESDISTLATAWRKEPPGQFDFRSSFVLAIGRIDGALAASTLRELFAPEPVRGRVDVVRALGVMKHPAAVPALLWALGDDNENVRMWSYGALQALEQDQLRAGMLLALQDAHPDIVRAAGLLCPFYADASIAAAFASIDPATWGEQHVQAWNVAGKSIDIRLALHRRGAGQGSVADLA